MRHYSGVFEAAFMNWSTEDILSENAIFRETAGVCSEPLDSDSVQIWIKTMTFYTHGICFL